MVQKKVTIVMTIRENYSLTLKTIESLREQTKLPYRFILIDYKVPDSIKKSFSKYENLEIIPSDHPYPSMSMANVITQLDTQYTIFLDNNILFKPLWLEKLIECMELDNKIGIVGPAYLWKKNKIHMYGGDTTIIDKNFSEVHYLVDEDENLLKSLKPRKCDYVEYHCLMVKTDLLKKNVLDPTLLIIHQHIDLSFAAKKLGYDTYITPYSVITYENDFKLVDDNEKAFFKTRWDYDIVEKDIAYFCQKWNLNNNNCFDNVRDFAKRHVAQYL
jgi:GT2 family glycosyltransferase